MGDSILDKAAELWEKKVDEIVINQPVSKDFYEFQYSTGKEIGKTFPQVDTTEFRPKIDTIYSIEQLPDSDDFNGQVFLKKSAKLTDIISSWQGTGLMINDRCKNLLKNFNLGNFRFFKFKCYHKHIKYDYCYLFIENSLTDYIDYKNSVFYIEALFSNYLRDVTFSSSDELHKYSKQIDKGKYEKPGYSEGKVEDNIQLKQIFLQKSFADIDIITWRATHYFSKKLVDTLLANNISGAYFKETRKIFK